MAFQKLSVCTCSKHVKETAWHRHGNTMLKSYSPFLSTWFKTWVSSVTWHYSCKNGWLLSVCTSKSKVSSLWLDGVTGGVNFLVLPWYWLRINLYLWRGFHEHTTCAMPGSNFGTILPWGWWLAGYFPGQLYRFVRCYLYCIFYSPSNFYFSLDPKQPISSAFLLLVVECEP